MNCNGYSFCGSNSIWLIIILIILFGWLGGSNGCGCGCNNNNGCNGCGCN